MGTRAGAGAERRPGATNRSPRNVAAGLPDVRRTRTPRRGVVREPLPPLAVAAATEGCGCDIFLTIGTSAVVYPAAGLVHEARRRGAFTVEINLEPTPASDAVELAIHGPADQLLPNIAQRLTPDCSCSKYLCSLRYLLFEKFYDQVPSPRAMSCSGPRRDLEKGERAVCVAERHSRQARRRQSDRLECLDLLGLGGPTTAGKLAAHTGITTGAMTAVIDRLERAGFARRLQLRRIGAAFWLRRPDRLRQIEAMYQPLAVAVARLNEDYGDRQLAVIVDYLSRAVTLAAEHVVWLQTQQPLTAKPPARRPRRRRGAGGRTTARIRDLGGMTASTGRGRLCGLRRLNNLHELLATRD